MTDIINKLHKQQISLVNYISKQHGVLDYYAYDPIEECGHCVPRGIVVACDLDLLHKLQAHAKRYYPDMVVVAMTVADYIGHINRPCVRG